MKNWVKILTLAGFVSLGLAMGSLNFAKADYQVIDQQSNDSANSSSNSPWRQQLASGLSGTVVRLKVELSGGVYVYAQIFDASTTQASSFDTQKLLTSGYGYYNFDSAAGIVLNPTHQYYIVIRPVTAGQTFNIKGTTSGLNNCRVQTYNQNAGFDCPTYGGGITDISFQLLIGQTMEFKHPQQCDENPCTNYLIGDFAAWIVQEAYLPATTSSLTLTVSTILGRDSLVIPANFTSTSTYFNFTVPKSYALPAGSTTTPLSYTANAKINYRNSNGSLGAEIVNVTTYFNITADGPYIPAYNPGYYGGIDMSGSLSPTTTEAYQTSYNQYLAQQGVDVYRQNLNTRLPFSYIYQIFDAISQASVNGTSTDFQTLSLTIPRISQLVTSSSTAMFTATTTMPFLDKTWFFTILPVTTWNTLRDLWAAVVYAGVLFMTYRRINTLWQQGG